MAAKAFKCRDIGVECDFEAKGENTDEVMKKVVAHAKSAHGHEQISPEMASRMRGAIRDTGSKTSGAGAGGAQM